MLVSGVRLEAVEHHLLAASVSCANRLHLGSMIGGP